MSLKDEIVDQVRNIFRASWTTTDGRVVPEAENVAFANAAVELDPATVLYADMSGSTDLVNLRPWQFAAEVYKTFLYCAARIITSEDGTITAYDGDRIMAVFIGNTPNSSAARAALKINYCRIHIISPLLRAQYPDEKYELKHVVGIDRSALRAARTGARGANDLVWVGRAANYAAKLTTLPDSHPTWITDNVYNCLSTDLKTTNGTPMWDQMVWNAMNSMTIYRTNWHWAL